MASTSPQARKVVEQGTGEAERDEHERADSVSAVREATKRVQELKRLTGLERFVFENALTIVAFAFFAVSMLGLVMAGHSAYNEDQRQHGGPTISVASYLESGHFMEAAGENWESAFLQMGVFVLLTRFLYQRGSSESKRIEGAEAVDQDPTEARSDPNAPWPVRRGGMWLTLYRNSLSGVTLLLFALSLWLHAAVARPYRRGPARAPWRNRVRARLHRHQPVLVRVVPELAERILLRRRPCLAHDLVPPARLAAVEAGGGAHGGYRRVVMPNDIPPGRTAPRARPACAANDPSKRQAIRAS
jgi:hypothetical protein